MQKTAYEVRISDWSSDVCSSDLGAVGEQRRLVRQAIALPDHRVDGERRSAVIPFESIGDARAVLEPIVAVEAVDREQIAVLEVKGARILVRDIEILDRRRRDDLDARGQGLRPAHKFADEGPDRQTGV